MASSQIVGPVFAGVLAKLHSVCFAHPWDQTAFESLLNQTNTIAWLASYNDHPSGFLVVSVVGEEAEILTLGVVPECRRRKIADHLLKAFLEASPADQVARVHLEVAEDNQSARAFYESKGFREVGRRPAYYRSAPIEGKVKPPPVDALILTLEVRPEEGKSGRE